MVVRSGFDDFEAIQLPVGERELTRESRHSFPSDSNRSARQW